MCFEPQLDPTAPASDVDSLIETSMLHHNNLSASSQHTTYIFSMPATLNVAMVEDGTMSAAAVIIYSAHLCIY